MPRLNPPIQIQQKALGYCLPACSQMALAQLGIQATQTQLAQILATRFGIGTPFSNIKRLKQWQIKVQVTEWGGVDSLINALNSETAIIVAVTTTPGLPGWAEIRTQHTVLIIDITSNQVVYLDPAQTESPIFAPRDEFLLAWSEMAELVAFLKNL